MSESNDVWNSSPAKTAIPTFLVRKSGSLAKAAVVGGAAAAGLAALGAAACAGVFTGVRRRRFRRLRGQTVLVTGSSRGLGLALAEEFARHGAKVALTARDPDELQRARKRLLDAGARTADILAVPADLTDQQRAERLVQSVSDVWGRLDILVNNAGIITVGRVENQTADDFHRVMEANFFTGLHCTLSALPQMLERRSGSIVNIASIGGKLAVPHLLPYTASKFAVVGFSEGLHAEMRNKGIHVLTVCPGLMRTGSHLNAQFSGDAPREYRWFSFGATTPLVSASARHAARRIVRGLVDRETELFVTPQAAVAGRLAPVMPEVTAMAMSLVNRLLPDPATQNARAGRGAEVREREPATARIFGGPAAWRYNEIARGTEPL